DDGVAAVAQHADRIGDALSPRVLELDRDHAAPPSLIARQTRSGCSGMSMSRAPRASQTAPTTAGVAAIRAASPMPFTPSGLVGDGVTVRWVWIEGRSAADGTR